MVFLRIADSTEFSILQLFISFLALFLALNFADIFSPFFDPRLLEKQDIYGGLLHRVRGRHANLQSN